jgi:hypothetical protein
MEVMTAVYEKALKRRDLSGVVDKEKEKGAVKGSDIDSKGGGKKGEKGKGKTKGNEKVGGGKGDAKAGANVGKIVNLMSGDTSRVRIRVSVLSMN